MQKKCSKSRRLLSFILCSVLIVAMALFTAGCNGSSTGTENGAESAESSNDLEQQDDSTSSDGSAKLDENVDSDADTQQDGNSPSDGGVLGEGSTKFLFAMEDPDGSRTEWEIHTDKTTVGEALLELGLIDGDDGEFGLYVKTVNEITLDYDKDGMYWAFYVNDEYAQSGVDSTEIKEGDTYLLKAEKS